MCDVLRSHLVSWIHLNWRTSAQRHISWGIWRKPKVALFNELQLHGASTEVVALPKSKSSTNKKWTYSEVEDHEFMLKSLVNDWEEVLSDGFPCNNGNTTVHRENRLHNKRRNLLIMEPSQRKGEYTLHNFKFINYQSNRLCFNFDIMMRNI